MEMHVTLFRVKGVPYTSASILSHVDKDLVLVISCTITLSGTSQGACHQIGIMEYLRFCHQPGIFGNVLVINQEYLGIFLSSTRNNWKCSFSCVNPGMFSGAKTLKYSRIN